MNHIFNCAGIRNQVSYDPHSIQKLGAPVAKLAEHRVVIREIAGSTPGRINTKDLKITEEKVLSLQFHLQMVRLSSLLR